MGEPAITTTVTGSSTVSTISTVVTSPLIELPTLVDTRPTSTAPTTVVSSLNQPISQPNEQLIYQSFNQPIQAPSFSMPTTPGFTAEMISKLHSPVIQPIQSLNNNVLNSYADLQSANQRSDLKKPQNDVKLKKFNGKPAEYPNFKAHLMCHLTARQQIGFIENDIHQRQTPASPQLISEDMDIQRFIAGNCVKSVRDHIQNRAKSAKHMIELLDAQYGMADPRLIDEAFNFIRTGQLASSSGLEDYIRRFEIAFDVLEQNEMGLNDKLKSKFFFCGMDRVRKELEQYTLMNKLNYNEMLGYIRDYFSSHQNEHVLCGVHPNATVKKRKFNEVEGQKQHKHRKYRGGYRVGGGYKKAGGHQNQSKQFCSIMVCSIVCP